MKYHERKRAAKTTPKIAEKPDTPSAVASEAVVDVRIG